MDTTESEQHTSRLAHETSPYLLQHARNPVDWYPWGSEALETARAEDKPIFLSVGYAACHWCHVMERESFEDQDTARLLNERFVAIKVDREERPDIDSIYMEAVQQMTGSGGWPMSVFLTPDGRPFYGGTYFPETARHGLPSFRQVLEGVSDAWHERRAEVEQAGASLASVIGREIRAPESDDAISRATLDAALANLEGAFDALHGGWGGAPKFPQPMTLELLLRMHALTGDDRPLAMARRTLDSMASGGIYDQLGGGFARYATDSSWLVPHFEKMLYDNSQLARAYVHAWQVTGDARCRRVAEETLDFMLRELRVDGGFAASLDADTQGVEGKTYVWDEAEIDSVLGDSAAAFKSAYGVTPNGNWEGSNILARVADEAAEPELAGARAALLARRHQRPQPARDDKVLAAWNGLAIAALADAGVAFARPDLIDAAAIAATEVTSNLLDADGRLRRSWKDGRALHAGVLEDYVDLADGLLALYEASFEERWFATARQLMDVVIGHFGDPSGGFFDTADDHETLITRPKGIQDNALPSGGAMATTVLLQLFALTGDERYSTAAERALGQVAPLGARYPTAFAEWLNALAFVVGEPIEIAVSGPPDAADVQALLAVARSGFRPFSVIAVGRSDQSLVPLLHDRPQRDGRATAYVCRRFACRAPVTEPADLAAQITSGP